MGFLFIGRSLIRFQFTSFYGNDAAKFSINAVVAAASLTPFATRLCCLQTASLEELLC